MARCHRHLADWQPTVEVDGDGDADGDGDEDWNWNEDEVMGVEYKIVFLTFLGACNGRVKGTEIETETVRLNAISFSFPFSFSFHGLVEGLS